MAVRAVMLNVIYTNSEFRVSLGLPGFLYVM